LFGLLDNDEEEEELSELLLLEEDDDDEESPALATELLLDDRWLSVAPTSVRLTTINATLPNQDESLMILIRMIL
jgi:hypothetical protein